MKNLNDILKGSLEPGAINPVIKNGKLYRTVTPDDLEDIVKLEETWKQGWKEEWGRCPAFPREWMKQDLEMFPSLQILAIQQKTGEAVGKISAVRLAVPEDLTTEALRTMGEEGPTWDYPFENYRHPQGVHVEGSGLAVRARGISDVRDTAINLGTYMVRAVAEDATRGPDITHFTFQARNPGFRKWLKKQGMDNVPHDETLKLHHETYVDGALSGKIRAPVLSIYSGFLHDVEGIEVVNKHAAWPGDYPSCELGVRFDATELVRKLQKR